MSDNNWDSSTQDGDNISENESFDQTIADDDDSSAATTGSTTDLEVLQAELTVTKQKLEELTRIAQQALADLSNYKKRTEEEKKQFVDIANTNLINALLPILDNMHLSLEHAPQDEANKAWSTGINVIFKQLEDTLISFGLAKIDHDEKDFDPNFHEAISVMTGPKDKIIKAFQNGYKMGERVLRRSKVAVGKGEEESASK